MLLIYLHPCDHPLWSEWEMEQRKVEVVEEEGSDRSDHLRQA